MPILILVRTGRYVCTYVLFVLIQVPDISVHCYTHIVPTISFWVSVPVLSVRRYSILPNSSGMVLVLTMVLGMALSLWIVQLYIIFPMSKLTLRLHYMMYVRMYALEPEIK